jgi:hypothetical protein
MKSNSINPMLKDENENKNSIKKRQKKIQANLANPQNLLLGS